MFRSIASIASLVLACATALGAVACDKDANKKKSDAPPLGEPIGADVQAKGTVPAFSLAVAVTKGEDPVKVLPPLVSAVSSALGACPAFVAEEKDALASPTPRFTALDFTIAGGKMKVTPRADSSPGLSCLVTALDGKDIAATPMDGRVELKMSPAGKNP